jgi:hypothetical protein
MTPTPHPPVRRERGHADGSFLRKLTMVCLIVLVLSGLIVYWIGETETPSRPGGRPPTAHPGHQSEPKPSADRATPGGQRLAHADMGGEGCG